MRGLGEPRRTDYGPVRKEGRRQDTQTLQSQNPLGLVAGGGGTRQNRWGSELPAWEEVEKVEWHLPLLRAGLLSACPESRASGSALVCAYPRAQRLTDAALAPSHSSSVSVSPRCRNKTPGWGHLFSGSQRPDIQDQSPGRCGF